MVLRRLARNVGLTRCASLQKRAIQFGTRIANKNPYPNANPNPDPNPNPNQVSLDEIVHPAASAAACAADAAPAQRSRPREALAKPRSKPHKWEDAVGDYGGDAPSQTSGGNL